MRIVLSTIGTYGDLFPVLAVGRALAERGVTPVLAVERNFVGLAEEYGFEAIEVHPGLKDVSETLGESFETTMQRSLRDKQFYFSTLVPHRMEEGIARLRIAAQDAVLLAATVPAMAAKIVAEATGRPLVPLFLQPAAAMLLEDPPIYTGLQALVKAPGPLGRTWNRLLLPALLKRKYGIYADRVNAARRSAGLSDGRQVPYFRAEVRPPVSICLYPRVMHRYVADNSNLYFAGFCRHNPDRGSLPEELDRFLANGPAPVVFTLGSTGDWLSKAFYRDSKTALNRMGQRGVLLTGQADSVPALDGNVLTMKYAPHYRLFPRAAAVVSHGGIGTVAEALAAGVPQLLVPYVSDGPDNAARLCRMGVAEVVPGADYDAAHAAEVLTRLLEPGGARDAAARLAADIAAEDGAARAADRLIAAAKAAA